MRMCVCTMVAGLGCVSDDELSQRDGSKESEGVRGKEK